MTEPLDHQRESTPTPRGSNDAIAEKARRLRFVARVPFLCECGDPACRELVPLPLLQFGELRGTQQPVLAEGHRPGPRIRLVERVVRPVHSNGGRAVKGEET